MHAREVSRRDGLSQASRVASGRQLAGTKQVVGKQAGSRKKNMQAGRQENNKQVARRRQVGTQAAEKLHAGREAAVRHQENKQVAGRQQEDSRQAGRQADPITHGSPVKRDRPHVNPLTELTHAYMAAICAPRLRAGPSAAREAPPIIGIQQRRRDKYPAGGGGYVTRQVPTSGGGG